MKKCFLYLALLVSVTTFGQSDSITLYFEKLISHKARIPSILYNDTCYYSSTLLRVDIDEHSNPINLLFSDSAEDWLKGDLARLKKDLDGRTLKKYCKNLGINNNAIIIPIFIRSSPENCISKVNPQIQNCLLKFDNKILRGNCFFVEPVILTLLNSVN